MKITHNKVGQNLNRTDVAKTDKSEKAGEAKAGNAADALSAAQSATSGDAASKVNLSSRAQEMKQIKEAAMAAPDINEEKVARLQKAIDSGTYKVDAKEIADRMVDEQIRW